jgi:hypothetical protein
MKEMYRNYLVKISVLVVTTICLPLSVLGQERTNPRVLMLVDTSGSMAWDIAGFRTNGDGSSDAWDASHDCCPGVGGSRLFIAKEAMSQMVLATGDIDFALMKFPQRYYTAGNVSGCAECESINYRYNQVDGQFDRLRYYFGAADDPVSGECDFYIDFSTGNRPSWLAVPFVTTGTVGNSQEIVSWMDHYEFTGAGTVAASDFPGPWSDSLEQELRAEGYTPLGEAVLGAYNYLNEVIGSDTLFDCRPYSLLILSDGDPELPSGICDDPDDPVPAVQSLSALGVDTWVVGLAHESDTLDEMALAGGSGSAFTAYSEQELSSILYTIISESIVFEKCNYEDDDCDGLTDEDFRPDKTYCDPAGWVAANCPGADCPCPGP